MADTHITSGVVTVGSGLALVGSGMNVNVINTVNANISGQHIITNDGQLVVVASGHIQVDNFPTTSISGQSVNVGNFPTTSISGQTINIGNSPIVQTSVSGNSIAVYDGGLVAALSGISVVFIPPTVSAPVLVCGQTTITYLSGGTQLPDTPCRSGLFYSNINPSGTTTYTGGLDDNAPYWKDNSSDEKGQTYNIGGSPDIIPVTNADQLRVVAAHSGIVTLTYMAFT